MRSPAAAKDVDVLFESVSELGLALDQLDGQGLASRLQDLERVVRRAEAAIVSVLDTADQRGSWKADGHASVRSWARATVRWSDPEVRDRTRTVTLVRDAPAIAEELAAGRIGVAQVRELARARANPRVGEQLVEALPLLTGHAQELPFHDFKVCVQRWESLADLDGTHDSHEAAHAGRRANASMVGNTFHFNAQGGALDGTAMMEILRRFEDTEFAREWAALKAEHGDDACPAMLERTAGQRRFDALRAIFEQAASTAPGSQPPVPTVNLTMDYASYEAWLSRVTGADPEAPIPDPADVDVRRCETVDGIQVDPVAVVLASFVGRVRRLVMDRAGVVIELGRRQRLFTGSSR
ncbi:MAG: hypothetical protein ACR2HP_18670, partial [Ilumatobacteraceae bacterium]